MARAYNFSPGPGTLPEEVLLQAQRDMLDWRGLGMSVMEVSHRSSHFQELLAQVKQDLRTLLAIPDNYHILITPGGASNHFALLPLNLSTQHGTADYLVTGHWSDKAATEAALFTKINIAGQASMDTGLLHIPRPASCTWSTQADYLHYTPNETISGLAFDWLPQTTAPLVADMTSSIMSEPLDIKKFAVIYAGAQKNLGQAGITIVIIRADLIKEPTTTIPTLAQYRTYLEHNSCYNTPPTYAIYITALVLEWLKAQGGLPKIKARNLRKAHNLYQCIDRHPHLYQLKVAGPYRSVMNVAFTLPTQDITQQFLTLAQKRHLCNLRGHSSVGGIRASIYNAMPEDGVAMLVEFMDEFAKQY